MNKDKFTAEFDRRINHLQYCIEYYHSTGNIGSLLPALASCVSYCWCKSPIKNRKK